MLVNIEHQGCTILSLEINEELSVENVKKAISEKIRVPVSDQTLASGGIVLENGHQVSEYLSDGRNLVFLFLRQRKTTNIEIDLGQGKTVLIVAKLNWTVVELKRAIQEAGAEYTLGKRQFLTFARFILEDDRTLEEYKLKEGSRLTVFHLLEQYSPQIKKESEDAHSVDLLNQTSVPGDSKHDDLFSQSSPTLEFIKTSIPNTGSASITTPSLLSPLESVLQTDPILNQTQIAYAVHGKQFEIKESQLHSTENTFETRTIQIPGGFRTNRSKTVNGLPLSMTTIAPFDKMLINFTDGQRKVAIEIPVDSTVFDGMHALKKEIPEISRDRLLFFKGLVKLDEHRLLNHYGIVNGSTVVFRKENPLRRF